MKTAKLIFALALLPAFALGAEHKLTVGPEVVIAPQGKESQWTPAAAFDGRGTYLVVWSDGSGIWGGDADIHGVRLKADGSVIDAQPIVIGKAADFQKYPRVAWNGREWLVVWQDLRNGKDYDIYAARVSPAGKVLDPGGVAVCASKRDQVLPAVASDGAGASFVVWADFRGGNYDIRGAAVKDGKPGTATALISAPGEQIAPAAAWTGAHYLVACANGNRHFRGKHTRITSLPLVRVGRDGKLLDPKPTFHGFGITTFDCAIAATGERAFLMGCFQSGKVYNPNAVFGIFMDAAGTALAHDNPGRPMFSIPLAGVENPRPITLCSTGSAGACDVFHPVAAASGDWFLALHQEAVGGHKSGKRCHPFIRYQFIRAKNGKVVEEGVLTPSGAREKTPGAAGGAAGAFLVVYERNTGAGAQRVCARTVGR